MSFPSRLTSIAYPFALLLIGLVGFTGVLLSTRHGSGWVNDSFQYVSAAHNLAQGHGLTVPTGIDTTTPLSRYPPLFSVVLAMIEWGGGNPLRDVRMLNAIFFLVNVSLLAATIQQITHSLAFSLVGAGLATVSPVLVALHSWTLSEPLYLSLSMTCFLSLLPYFGRSDRRWLFASAILGGLAVLARYIGVAAVTAVVLFILLNRQKPWQTRIKDGGTYLGVGLLPFVAWSGYGLLATRTFNDRAFGLSPITEKNLISLVEMILDWFLPESIVQNRLKEIAVLSVLLGLLAIVLLLQRKSTWGRWRFASLYSEKSSSLLWLYAIYGGLYFIWVLAAKMLFDSWIGMSSRIFSPVMISVWILLVSLLASVWRNAKWPGRALIAAICLYWLLFYGSVSVPMVRRYYTQGISAPTRIMATSDLVETVLQIHDQGTVYTNWLYWYYLWTGQPANWITEAWVAEWTNHTQSAKSLAGQAESSKPTYLVIFLKAPVPAVTRQATEKLTAHLTPWIADSAVSIYRLP